MHTNSRLRRSSIVFASTLVLLCLRCASSSAAPYEIPAQWKDRRTTTWPAAVVAPFRGIESVQGLGIVAYSDDTLLRVIDGRPFVTLGVRAEATDSQVRYTGAAALGPSERFLVRTRVRRDGGNLLRESDLVRVDLANREESLLDFPLSGSGTPWSVIRVLANRDGALLAYAGLSEPIQLPLRFDRIARAVDQRFFRSTGTGRWRALAHLPVEDMSVTAACAIDDAILAAGSAIDHDEDGEIRTRRPRSAVLRDDAWLPLPIAFAESDGVWHADALVCAGSSAFLLGVTARPDQPVGAVFLAGRPTLHHLDDGTWTQVMLPELGAAATTARVTASAIDRAGALWIATDAAGAVFRHSAGTWVPVIPPAIRDIGRVTIAGLAFDDDGTAWAIANLPGDVHTPEPRGLLFRYDGSNWQLRGVTWSPLRQRGFGLLGPLE